jgi:hypothetical protein
MNANKTGVLELEMREPETSASPLENLVTASPRSDDRTEVQLFPVVGLLAGFTDAGVALVEFPGSSEAIPARHTCTIKAEDVGRGAVLVFEEGDVCKPIIMGLLRPENLPSAASPESSVDVSLDGEQVTLSARKEIVLRCGKASITLTRAGKIIIRGAYVLSRSSGVNRIKGGSVQIN